MKVTVDQAFWDLFPTARITVMSLYGIDNTVDEAKDPYFKELLDKGTKRAWEFIDEENYTQSEFVQEWRQAFSKFKTKKGARSSIEALLKRVHQGREFYPINPLVDLYNSVSMAYALPCGGEDMDKLVGGLSLGQAKGGEPFFPLGAEEDAPALEGEIISSLVFIFKDKEFTKDIIEDHNGHLCKEGFNQIDLALVIVDKLPDNSWELLDKNLGQGHI